MIPIRKPAHLLTAFKSVFPQVITLLSNKLDIYENAYLLTELRYGFS